MVLQIWLYSIKQLSHALLKTCILVNESILPS